MDEREREHYPFSEMLFDKFTFNLNLNIRKYSTNSILFVDFKWGGGKRLAWFARLSSDFNLKVKLRS